MADLLVDAGFGVWGRGIERGDRMLASTFAGLFLGVADVGVFVFSVSRGFVVEIFAGACFFAAAAFAASAPSWRIARFCSGFGCTTFSFFVVVVEVAVAGEDTGAAAEGFAGRGVKVEVTPNASRSSSYSFHSSISSMPYLAISSLRSYAPHVIHTPST